MNPEQITEHCKEKTIENQKENTIENQKQEKKKEAKSITMSKVIWNVAGSIHGGRSVR